MPGDILLAMRTRPGGWKKQVRTDEGLRRVLLKFIADFANWDNAAKAEYLEAAERWFALRIRTRRRWWWTLRGRRLHPVGGPASRLRRLCQRPKPCRLLDPQGHAGGHPPPWAGARRRPSQIGTGNQDQGGERAADLYPKDPDGATPIAYLWARTGRCEAPDCGAEIPPDAFMWLCRKPSRKYALHPNIVREEGAPPRVEFGIFGTKFDSTVANATVSRARATCPCCKAVLPPERVRSQLAAQRGGADVGLTIKATAPGGARMTAVVMLKPGREGPPLPPAN